MPAIRTAPPTRLLLAADAAAAAAAFALARGLHAALVPHLPWLLGSVPLRTFVAVGVMAVLVWTAGSAAFGLPRAILRPGGAAREFVDLLRLHALGLVILTLFLFLLQIDFNRSILLLFVGSSLALMSGLRVGVRRYLRLQRRMGHGSARLLVVGDPTRLASWLLPMGELAPRVVGRLGGSEAASDPEVPLLGPLDDARDVLHRVPVDLVLFLPPYERPDLAPTVLAACEEVGVPAAFPLGLDRPDHAAPRVFALLDRPVLLYDVAPKPPESLAVKHAADAVAAGVGLLVLSPLLLVVALAILATMGRPILFVQPRAGLFGRVFPMLKFRSMVRGAEAQRDELLPLNEAGGPTFKVTGDPRVTRLGAFLRRTSLDELPQLGNVLVGQMSLVGPRPLPTVEQQAIRGWQRRRLSMKPGITGLWQVSGRSDTTFEEWMRLDLRYVDEWSLALDVEILLRTVPAVLAGSGAK